MPGAATTIFLVSAAAGPDAASAAQSAPAMSVTRTRVIGFLRTFLVVVRRKFYQVPLLLEQRHSVAPDRQIDELVVGDRFLAGLDGVDLLHQRDRRLELGAVEAVIVGGPEVDRQELLERRLVDVLRVAGRGGRLGD